MERIRGFLSRSRSKPGWTITGVITGGLIAYDLRYGIAFFLLTGGLWFSYMYGYSKGAGEMHDNIFTRIRAEVLPLKILAQAGDFAVKPDEEEDDGRR